MTEELKPIDVSKYTVTESGNVIRTDNKETLKNALARIEELEKENAELKDKLDIITKNAEPAGKMLVDMVKHEVEKAEQGKLAELKDNLAYAKAVMRELLDNSSEYARQMAMDFLEAN